MPALSQIKRQRILDFPARIKEGHRDSAYDDHYAGTEDLFKRSTWLSFMEKRLRTAYPRLAEDGLMFVSIDDNGQAAGSLSESHDCAWDFRHIIHNGGKAERADTPIDLPRDMAMYWNGGAMKTVRMPGVQP